MNEIKEYRLKEDIKKAIVVMIDTLFFGGKLSKESIVEMLEELINLYKN